MKREQFSQWRTGFWEPKCGPCDPTVQSTWNFLKNLNFFLYYLLSRTTAQRAHHQYSVPGTTSIPGNGTV